MSSPVTPPRRALLQGLGAAALGLSFEPLSGCSPRRPVGANGEELRLNFYNWDSYTGRTTMADFRRQTGIKVRTSLFGSNEEMFSKLRAGNPGFDLIVPANDFVTQLRVADLLQPLDLAKIPNRRNLMPQFQTAPYDPGRRYSMPYSWVVLGIGYRKSKVDGVPDSWKWMMDSDRYKGRIGLFSEGSLLIPLGAKYLGYSPAHIPPARIEQIEQIYLRQKPNIKLFHRGEGSDQLMSGEIDIVMDYNGDMAQVMAEDPDLDFVVPREGSLLSSDSLCIPKGAPRPDNAHQFFNFILDGANGARIYETIKYPTPNAAALALMPASYRQNPVIFPPADVMAKCEFLDFEGLARASLFDEVGTRILAS